MSILDQMSSVMRRYKMDRPGLGFANHNDPVTTQNVTYLQEAQAFYLGETEYLEFRYQHHSPDVRFGRDEGCFRFMGAAVYRVCVRNHFAVRYGEPR